MLILFPIYCSIYLGVSGTISKLPGLLIRLSAGSSDIARTMVLFSCVTTGETLVLEYKCVNIFVTQSVFVYCM